MPRLGDTRQSKNRLGSLASSVSRTSEGYVVTVETSASATLGRIVETFSSTIETEAVRADASYDRTSETFIPATFDTETGRLGDYRLGSLTLGGGKTNGIATNASRALTFERGPVVTFIESIETESDRQEIRDAETWMGILEIQSDSIIPFWQIDGSQVPGTIEEVRDWQELKLTWRANLNKVKNVLRDLDTNSGSVEVLVQSDGSFITFDRANGKNTYGLVPPTARSLLRQEGDYVVDDYKEEVVGPNGEMFEVTVKFVSDKSRESTSSISETRGTGEWKFEFSSSTISTSRVKSKISSKTKTGEGTKKIRVVLTEEQAKVIEESATYTESVTVHEVPDGENFAVDESPGDRNTVTVTAPTDGEDVLPSGTYAVTDWETSWTSDDFFTVELEIVKT